MNITQAQKDKERFFTDLDLLGESDDEVVLVSERKVSQSAGMVETKPGGVDLKQDPCSIPLAPTHHPAIELEVVELEISSERPTRTRKTRGSPHSTKSKPSRKTKLRSDTHLLSVSQKIFHGFTFFFIPNNDIAKPRKTRIHSSIARGADWARLYGNTVTHVIVDSHLNIDSAVKALPREWRNHLCIVVRDSWLVESIVSNFVQDFSQSRFRVKGDLDAINPQGGDESLHSEATNAPFRPLKRKAMAIEPMGHGTTPTKLENDLNNIIREMQEIGDITSDKESEQTTSFATTIPETSFEDDAEQNQKVQSGEHHENRGFQCMEINDGGNDNPNLETIQMLQKMASYYDRTGDHWRATAYRKAIAALYKQKQIISTKEEAMAIPQIGKGVADKIEEIVTTSKLQRLETAAHDPRDQALQLFLGIYGVGLAQANLWLSKGYRTLDDLAQHVRLSENQRIGIAHYADFQLRIPRIEVAQHVQIVQRSLYEVDTQLDAIVGGSYRRGQRDSGDIDILITKRDADMGLIRSLVMKSVVPNLTRSGFLKAVLATSTKNDQGSKWHGASCLPGHTTWRRIDLLFVPWSEMGAALIYFTGNDIFNRSIRLLAKRKGMKLTQHGLYTGFTTKDSKAKGEASGQLLEGQSEKKIFDILGVPWRPPEHRRC